jgi:serine/threonine-protein phosphatase 2A regulatory subunit B
MGPSSCSQPMVRSSVALAGGRGPTRACVADKTVKLYKVHQRATTTATEFNVSQGRFGGRSVPKTLKLPSLARTESTVCATSRRIFANAHAYHINSISVNSDGATFLSADDLRINLWSLENAKLSFTLVDIKPEHMEELTEVITAASFHPRHCHMFSYSTSRGSVKLGDMRSSALCDSYAKVFEDSTEEPASKSYFSEITASVSDVTFLPGDKMATRDYLTVKLWDLRQERRPLKVVPVHEHLRPRLCDLYENDSIFDKFEVGASADGRHIITGTYDDQVMLIDTRHGEQTSIQLARTRAPAPRVVASLDPTNRSQMEAAAAEHGFVPDFSRKVLHYSWHPESDTVAIAGLNNLHIYNASRHATNPGGVSTRR